MAETLETIAPTETPAVAPAAAPVRPFHQAGLIAEKTLRKLRTQHQAFGQALASRLGGLLRLECQVTLAGVQTISFEGLVQRLLTPTHLTLFAIEPLRGIGLLETPPALALALVNRLLGGSGELAEGEGDRALTEIENVLLGQVTEMVLAEWCHTWHDLQPLTHKQLGHEVDGRYLHMTARGTMMLEVLLEITVGNQKQSCRFAFPYHALEPLLQRLQTAHATPGGETAGHTTTAVQWNKQLDDVTVRATAVCAGLRCTAGTLANLRVGDTLPLTAAQLNHLTLRLGDKPKFAGVLGKVGSRWAIQITRQWEEPNR